MMLYPIQLNVRGRQCVVVGAGGVAARKAASLAECGANVTLVAPEANASARGMAQSGQVSLVEGAYRAEHLDGAWVVFAATDNAGVNAQVTRDAQARGILVSDAGAPETGDFLSPSVVRRGELMLTASTGGGSPTLAAVVRESLETVFGTEWGPLTAIVSSLRGEVQQAGNEDARRRAVRRVIEDEQVRELIGQGKLLEAEARARECLLSSSE